MTMHTTRRGSGMTPVAFQQIVENNRKSLLSHAERVSPTNSKLIKTLKGYLLLLWDDRFGTAQASTTPDQGKYLAAIQNSARTGLLNGIPGQPTSTEPMYGSVAMPDFYLALSEEPKCFTTRAQTELAPWSKKLEINGCDIRPMLVDASDMPDQDIKEPRLLNVSSTAKTQTRIGTRPTSARGL